MSAQEEHNFWSAMGTMQDRIHNLETTVGERAEVMVDTIKAAVQEAMPKALLTDKQLQWVEMAIEREAQSIAFRRAVIEKSLLVVIGIIAVGAAALLKDAFMTHIWRM